MSIRWSEPNTLKLIQLYKSYEFLWDRNSDLYKSMYARKQAYDAIVNEMEVPGISALDVKSKIKNLRTSYYQELRKMACYKAKNKTIKPLKWFIAFKSIMGNVTGDGSDAKQADSNSESDEYEEEDQSGHMDENLFQEESTSNSDAYVVSIKQEFLDEMNNLGDKVMPPTICDYLEPVVPKRYKSDKNKTEDDVGAPIPTTSTKKAKNVDEFQLFANNIALQLRKLPLNRALSLQIEVQKMIARERIDLLKKRAGQKNDEDSS